MAARTGATVKKWLRTGAVLSATGEQLAALAADDSVGHLSGDTQVRSMGTVANEATGADQAWAGTLPGVGSVTGRGVGVAFLDSGYSRHLALKDAIIEAKDFTAANGTGEDQLGHGTHIAGLIGSRSAEVSGVAPGAWLVSLKVLGADGSGRTSDVIRAIDYAIANKERLGLGVLNLSLGRPVFESYVDDPLCQAVERAFRAGLVVVVSAGNYGKTEDGRKVLRAIGSPGNSPFALTVGAMDDQGTPGRGDDTVADFSSWGPTLYDQLLKPDVAAPGRRVASLYAPGSTLARRFPERLVSGNGQSGVFELSGTSISTAIVAGIAALVREANPNLTPLQVRIAIQMSSTFIKDAGLVGAGAGSVNAAAAVQLARSGPATIRTLISEEPITNSALAFLNTSAGNACACERSRLGLGRKPCLGWRACLGQFGQPGLG